MKKSITTIIMDTESPELSKAALNRSLLNFQTDEVLIYTDQPSFWEGFPTKKIEKFQSVSQYSECLIKLLPEDVRTDFVLVIQYDGFVINGSQFSPHFLYYDYIGAPWPNFNEFSVGNGGFSLRSRRLIESAARYIDILDGEPEDTFICRSIRTRLEERDRCIFAPIGLAQHFSTEFKFYPWPTFGFHGYVMLPFVYQDNLKYLLDNLPEKAFSGDKLKQMNVFFDRASADHRKLLDERLNGINK